MKKFIDKMRGSLRSKTAWFAYMLVTTGLIDQIQPGILQLVPPKYNGLAAIVIGGVVFWLRSITSKPLEEK